MKSRELKTIHDLIVRDYKIEPIGGGKFHHSFKPATTETIYQFVANGIPEVTEGERYNIGYYEDEVGNKIIEPSCLSKNSEVNPTLSYHYSLQLAKEKHDVNKAKNDERVIHAAHDGYYWGKKYAWREFGLIIPKDAFYSYLDEINHSKVECVTQNPDISFNNEKSIAYKEEGLINAIKDLIDSAEKVTKVHYKSPLYSRKFTIRGLDAITDKK
ncbi:MAG: hypothetical protein V2A75_04140 [Pseudomonadota bacterium]